LEKLFIDQPDEELIKWNGKMLTREEATEKSGLSANDILYSQDMDRTVAGQLSASRRLTGITAACFSLDRLSMNAAPTPAEQYGAAENILLSIKRADLPLGGDLLV